MNDLGLAHMYVHSFDLWLKKKRKKFTPTVFYNNFIHNQPHMQEVRRCQAQAKPRGGDITLRAKVTLADQKPESEYYPARKCYLTSLVLSVVVK